MRRARKKPVRVNAYRLGEQSEGLDRLIKEGLVSQSDDGTFEVHTMETKDEKGGDGKCRRLCEARCIRQTVPQ